MKRISVIINPISGVKSKVGVVDALKKTLHPDFEYLVNFTERSNHATELSREAAEEAYDAVIAVGGDGTLNEVAKGLINTKTALGVIPMGSGNGFARHMKIPLNLKKAIETINAFNTELIDTAIVNGEPFIATVGLGFDALVGKKFADFGKRGLLSYMQVTTSEFMNFESSHYKLYIDGEKIKTKAFLINFANVGQYGNNAWIAPNASVKDGKLNVCLIEPFPAHLVADIIFKLFNKQLEKSKYYRTFMAEEIKVVAPNLYHLDGEPRSSKKDIEVKIVPSSLYVIC
jgi:YegS/Rv2252/BmrU family lipid kinase